MLKITRESDGVRVILNLEGGLAGPWVEEMERVWRRAVTDADGRPVRLFLVEVTFIDSAGKKLLEEMCRQGVEMVGAGCMNRAIVEEITHQKKDDPVCGAEAVSPLKKAKKGHAKNRRRS